MNENKNIGALTPLLIHPISGNVFHYDIIYSDSKLHLPDHNLPVSPYHQQNKKLEKNQVISSACMVCRTAALREIGFLQNCYAPVLFEDTDACMAMHDCGWELHILADVVIFHDWQTTTKDMMWAYKPNLEKFNNWWTK